MNIVRTQKHNDCAICSYAMAEGIPWKIAKRRLRKHLVSRKKLGVSSQSVREKGLVGFEALPDGSYGTFNNMFSYGTGIIFISFGNGYGHAMYWDGVKFIDHKEDGRFNNKNKLCLRDNEYINMVLVKKNASFLLKIKSRIYEFFDI